MSGRPSFLCGLAALRCLSLFSGPCGTTEVVPSLEASQSRARAPHRRIIGTKLMKLRRNTRSSGLADDAKKDEARFVLCVRNDGYPAGLEVRKIYRVLADEQASKLHQLRVIDESGEDYLYPEDYFVVV